MYSSPSASLYWPYDHLPLNISIITNKSESEQNPNQKPFLTVFSPELFTGDIVTVWGRVLTCSILKENELCAVKLVDMVTSWRTTVTGGDQCYIGFDN